MPVPPNITPDTAKVITATPYSDFQDVSFGGTTYTVWYRHTPTVNGMYQVRAVGNTTPLYHPTVQIFSPNAATDHVTASATDVPIQYWGQSGVDYFFKVSSSTGNIAGSANLEFLFAIHSVVVGGTIPSDSIVVNDDESTLPSVFIDPATGEILGYTPTLPSGEHGALLDNGLLLLEDDTNRATNGDIIVRLYDACDNYRLLTTTTISMPASGWQPTFIGGKGNGPFYLGWAFDFDNASGGPSYRSLAIDGTLSTPTALLGTEMRGLEVSNDLATLFYSGKNSAADFPIKRWNLSTNTTLTDLIAHVAGLQPSDILVLSGGRLAILYTQNLVSPRERTVRIYDSAGVFERSISFGFRDTRLGYDTDTTTFWVLARGTLASGDLGTATFYNINAATGATITSFTETVYDVGAYEGSSVSDIGFGISGDTARFWMVPCPADLDEVIAQTGVPDDTSTPCPDCGPTRTGGGPGTKPGGHTGDPPGTNPGPVEPPVDVTAWDVLCDGGGVVPTAADLTDAENWDD